MSRPIATDWDALKAASERHDPPAAAMWAGLHSLLTQAPQTLTKQGENGYDGETK